MPRLPSVTSLRLFLEVAKTASFSEAARKSAVSQPALSRTIRLLEEELQVRLFDRNTRNVELTHAGKMLFPVVDRLLGEYHAVFNELERTISGEHGQAVIGSLPSIAADVLPGLLGQFLALHPKIELTIHDSLAATLYEAMANRQIDLALLTPPDRAEEFAFTPLVTDEYVLIVPADDPLAETAADWAILGERPFIAMAPGSSVRRLTDMALAKASIFAKPRFECAQLATVGGLIAAGLGISALPRTTLPLLRRDDLAYRPLRNPNEARTLGLAKPATRALSPAAALLEHYLLDEARLQQRLSHLMD